MFRLFRYIISFFRLIRINIRLKRMDLKERLSELSESVEKTINNSEEDFLVLGKKIQKLHSETGNLGDVIKEVSVITAGDGEKSGLNYVGKLSDNMIGGLNSYKKRISEKLSIMDSIINDLNTLIRLSRNNEKIVTLLNVIALNIAIESNRTEKAVSMFAAFVKEIRELAEKIKGISTKLNDETAEVIKKQKEVRKAIFLKLSEFFAVTESAEKIVIDTGSLINQMVNSSIDSIEKASDCSNEAYRDVGKIVMAIQFHDIVRQKSEHVVTAVGEASEFLKKRWLKKNDIGKFLTILSLQTEQIKLIVSEVKKASFDVKSGFENIKIMIKQLEGLIDSVSSKENSVVGEKTFHKMVNGLKELDQLTEKAKVLNKEMGDTAGGASESSIILEKYISGVEGFSLDLQRKALNAIIKSSHLGDTGNTLEVFAIEVTKTADQSKNFANSVSSIVNSINERTKSQKKTEKVFNSDSETFDIGSKADNIFSLYMDFVEKNNEAGNSSFDMERSIKEVEDSFSFLSGFQDDIKALLKKTENLVEEIYKNIEGIDVKEGTEVLIKKYKDRYTMQSEREVHSEFFDSEEKKLINEKESEIYDSDKVKSDSEEDDDLGDNVDLF